MDLTIYLSLLNNDWTNQSLMGSFLLFGFTKLIAAQCLRRKGLTRRLELDDIRAHAQLVQVVCPALHHFAPSR